MLLQRFGRWLDRVFEVKARGSSLSVEFEAGMTTFFTMSYIVLLNPHILSVTGLGMRTISTFTATICCVSTFLVGVLLNLPIALGPGMGLNTFFAGAMVQDNLPLNSVALSSAISGLAVAVLAALGLIGRIVDMVPQSLKCAIMIGIGLYQTFIGLRVMGLVVPSVKSLVTLGPLTTPTVLSCLSLLLMVLLQSSGARGAILISILLVTAIAWVTAIAPYPSSLVSMPAWSFEARHFTLASLYGGETAADSDGSAGGVHHVHSHNVHGNAHIDAAGADSSDFIHCITFMLSTALILVFDTAGVLFGMAEMVGDDEEGSVGDSFYTNQPLPFPAHCSAAGCNEASVPPKGSGGAGPGGAPQGAVGEDSAQLGGPAMKSPTPVTGPVTSDELLFGGRASRASAAAAAVSGQHSTLFDRTAGTPRPPSRTFSCSPSLTTLHKHHTCVLRNPLARLQKAMVSRSVWVAAGLTTALSACFGGSAAVVFLESGAGIAAGGRTGLTAVVVALMFGITHVIIPLVVAVPPLATAPALVLIGSLMFSSVRDLPWDSLRDVFPAFLCFASMPFTMDVFAGIEVGVASYVLLNVGPWVWNLFAGRRQRRRWAGA